MLSRVILLFAYFHFHFTVVFKYSATKSPKLPLVSRYLGEIPCKRRQIDCEIDQEWEKNRHH